MIISGFARTPRQAVDPSVFSGTQFVRIRMQLKHGMAAFYSLALLGFLRMRRHGLGIALKRPAEGVRLN